MSNGQTQGLKRSRKARWIYRIQWLVLVSAPVVAIILVAHASAARLADFEKLGLVQPAVAALLSLAVILGMRLTWGRFADRARKGMSSASSAAIAVKLWMGCFTVLMAAMLLSTFVARLADKLTPQSDESRKSIETQIEVKAGAAAPAVTAVKVTR